jgi:hypothetical protein
MVGGIGAESGYAVQQTFDSGYVAVGSTSSRGAGLTDVYLVKIDSKGDTVWTRTFGGAGSDYGHSVRQTGDGGYVILGGTTSFGDTAGDIYVIKTNAYGDAEWAKTYGEAGEDAGNSLELANDGTIIITGYVASTDTGFAMLLLRISASGEKIWAKTIRDSVSVEGRSAQQTGDLGFIFAGAKFDFLAYHMVEAQAGAYLVKTDPNGETVWTKTFFEGAAGSCARQTNDGGYILAGRTGAESASLVGSLLLVKTDANGDSLWTKTLTPAIRCAAVRQAGDGGYIVAAESISRPYLVKTDLNGNPEWSRDLHDFFVGFDQALQVTNDGGYIIVGTGYKEETNDYEVCFIKTDENGYVK